MDHCPECDSLGGEVVSRRQFVQAAGALAAVAAATVPAVARAEQPAQAVPESLVKKLYDSLAPDQKEEICFDWDYKDDRGLLRMHVSNNWHITEKRVAGGFFNKDQQELIEALFWGLYSPDWHDRIKKQLKDDAGGYGKEQSIAIFGQPGTGKFEFVMTGRHLTIRCDGDSVDHVAFGGPIFYGHAASGFDEKVGHPGNVFWYQAQTANALFKMLDGKQREKALLAQAPAEAKVHFGGPDGMPAGIQISDLTSDQKEHAQKVLAALIEPYRTSDQAEVRKCLTAQGGLDKCRLAFYRSDATGKADLGDDGEWDNWRLEGPSFVWHYRGMPHVHVWVNIADDPSVKITARG
ncbi:MAG: DUF3500 domain-containing protein [Planctomycetes bacterium]|nr:DUF3500 domain-containing protein [Planctomycetota bacterium]